MDAPAADVAAPGDTAGDATAADLPPPRTLAVTILHTNDLHSHLQGHAPEADYTPATPGDDATVGGFARLASAIGGYRQAAVAAGQDTLLLDGGDFMMGTLFQLAGTRAAAELQLMKAVGYDAVAMGNHELDWTPAGLAAIIAAARGNGVDIPVLASNVVFDGASADDDALEALLAKKFVKTLPSGLKVGFFGLLGAQAAQFAPTAAPLKFTKIVDAARAMAAELRTVDKVDLVIALSHSGIGSDGQGEDRVLATMLPGAIDVIISGHTHQKLEQPVVVGSTIIVTAGSYGEYLGRLAIEVEKRGEVTSAVTVKSYNLLAIDDAIPGAPQAQAAIDAVIAGITTSLAPSGLAYDKVVAETGADIALEPSFVETGLGDLVTDAFLAAGSKLEPAEPPVFAVEVNGQLRAPIKKGKTGNVWFADLFRVTPLGLGPDRAPGAPLVTYYLSGKDIKAGLEISAAAKFLGDDVYTMQFSGIHATYDQTKVPFQRVTGVELTPPGGAAAVPIDLADATKCYKVVTTLYLAGLFGLAGQITGIPIVGKEKDCVTPANLFARLIDADPTKDGVQELKNYQAVLGFLAAQSDTDTDGVPNIPDRYATAGGRLTQTPAP